jgi:hypothetical protein
MTAATSWTPRDDEVRQTVEQLQGIEQDLGGAVDGGLWQLVDNALGSSTLQGQANVDSRSAAA